MRLSNRNGGRGGNRGDGQGFEEAGPLGSTNMRRQQGRSFLLTNDPERPLLRERLIFTGGVGKGNKGVGDAYASACTIACSRGGELGTVIGTIEWGTDGHSNVAYFDWLNGTCIHVGGSAFTLTAELVPDGANEAIAENTSVTVGASIAYYAASRRPPTRTIYAPLAGLGPVELEVPSFASVLHVASTITPLVVQVEFLSGAGLLLSLYTATAFGNGSSVPIPNGAKTVRLTGAGAQLYAAIFGLSL